MDTRNFPTDRQLTEEETAYWAEQAGVHGKPAIGMFAIQEQGIVVFVLKGKLDLTPSFAIVRGDYLTTTVATALGIVLGVGNLPQVAPPIHKG